MHHRVWELLSLRPGRVALKLSSRQSIQPMSLHQRPAAQLIRLEQLSMVTLSPMQPTSSIERMLPLKLILPMLPS